MASSSDKTYGLKIRSPAYSMASVPIPSFKMIRLSSSAERAVLLIFAEIDLNDRFQIYNKGR